MISANRVLRRGVQKLGTVAMRLMGQTCLINQSLSLNFFSKIYVCPALVQKESHVVSEK